jgi:hypothetical protein
MQQLPDWSYSFFLLLLGRSVKLVQDLVQGLLFSPGDLDDPCRESIPVGYASDGITVKES